MDFESDFDPDGDATNEIENFLLRFRDAAQAESEEEQSKRMLKLFDETVAQMFSQTDTAEVKGEGGFEMLVEYYENSFDRAREDLERWGYIEYFEKVDQLAIELIKEGKGQEVTDFYDNELEQNTGMMQRLINPLIEEYLSLLESTSN